MTLIVLFCLAQLDLQQLKVLTFAQVMHLHLLQLLLCLLQLHPVSHATLSSLVSCFRWKSVPHFISKKTDEMGLPPFCNHFSHRKYNYCIQLIPITLVTILNPLTVSKFVLVCLQMQNKRQIKLNTQSIKHIQCIPSWFKFDIYAHKAVLDTQHGYREIQSATKRILIRNGKQKSLAQGSNFEG